MLFFSTGFFGTENHLCTMNRHNLFDNMAATTTTADAAEFKCNLQAEAPQ